MVDRSDDRTRTNVWRLGMVLPSREGPTIDVDPTPPGLMNPEKLKRLLASDPAAAEAQARRALTRDAADADGLFLLAAALRRRHSLAEAKAILEPLVRSQPQMVEALIELGTVLVSLGETREAVDVLSRAVDLAPFNTDAWFALSNSFLALEPFETHEEDSVSIVQLANAKVTLSSAKVETIAALVQQSVPDNQVGIPSIRRTAEYLFRSGRRADAETMMARCVETAPDSRAVRFHYLVVLCGNGEVTKALRQMAEIFRGDRLPAIFRILRAFSLALLQQYRHSIGEYESILEDHPQLPGTWFGYAAALRAVGRHRECCAAIQKSIALLPSAEAWCFLAGVKSFHFGQSEIDALRLQLARRSMPMQSHAQLRFALGKALEDVRQFHESSENYRRSNDILHARTPYDSAAKTQFVQRSKQVFTADLFASCSGSGAAANDPIFIVGMPRAGSTLIEQILSSHSKVEGLRELPYMNSIATRLDREQVEGVTHRYPEVLRFIGTAGFQFLGERYLNLARPQRKLGCPFFTDKMPGNHSHIGLLQLILPNAKIIDMRRHPLDCGLSCYKNYFPSSQPFSHYLRDIGRYYADYVELMAHYDDVLPSKVHRVFYEHLVADPEKEVRAMLEYLDLPFEDGCLRFYDSDAAVTTLSSEQVRVPIYDSAVGHWRNFNEMLDPLKHALGYVLDLYPAVPKFHPQVRATPAGRSQPGLTVPPALDRLP